MERRALGKGIGALIPERKIPRKARLFMSRLNRSSRTHFNREKILI